MQIKLNADPEEVFSTVARKLVFVHVGKCAGESIMHTLRFCLPDNFAMFEMHVYDANVRIRQIVEAEREDLIYLVAKREPLSRYISAFNWDKHNLYLKGVLKSSPWEDCYQRFPTVDDLASGIASEDPEVNALAQKFSRFGHMGMGQTWYTPEDVYERLPTNQTLYLDTSTLKCDLLKVLKSLVDMGADEELRVPVFKSDFGGQYENASNLFPTFLSDKNRSILLSHLKRDVDMYKSMSANE